jgi:hypothetical protein
MSKDLIAPLQKKLKTPEAVQKFLRTYLYNREEGGETLASANEALKAKSFHCLEACFVAAAILEKYSYPPLVLSLESQDYLDHVLYVYKHRNRWGSIGRSREEGLHGRKPVFKNLRELARSYIEPYIDLTGRITAYAVVSLDECKADWRYSKTNVWSVEKFLSDYPHKKLNCSETTYNKILDRFKAGYMAKIQKYWI